ncbi:MAG: GNAT family N-acetyltransferase [Casimicrobiaceae bacterium]
MALASIVEVHSRRLLIRPVAEDDLEDLQAINGDPEVTRFLPYATWVSRDDASAWLKRMAALTASGTGRQLVVVTRDTGKVVGTLLLFRYEEGSARVELGYVLGRRYWRQGFMSEAITAICEHAFGSMAMRRIEAEVNTANTASDRLLRKVGFMLEGTRRQRWVAKGVAYDTNLYGCLAEDRARTTPDR